MIWNSAARRKPYFLPRQHTHQRRSCPSQKSFTPSPSSSANFKTLTASFSIFKNGVYLSWQAETMPKIAIFDYQLANPSSILHRLSPSISLTPAPLPRPADTSSSVSCSLPTRTSWTSSAQVRIVVRVVRVSRP